MSAKAASRPKATEARKRPPAAYNSRLQPKVPHYTVEEVRGANGAVQEVITIEDTPEPQAFAGNAVASTSAARYDRYGSAAEPVAKRRKSDGAHISDNPYAPSASSSSRAKQLPPAPGYHDGRNGDGRNGVASGSGSKNKRKHDPYEEYDDRGHDRRPAQKSRPAAVPADDQDIADKEGHFIVRPGTEIFGYKIIRLLGQGTFGKVVAAKHILQGTEHAIKVIRNVPKYREASKIESTVLKLLRERDMDNRYKCIWIEDQFDFKNHVCFVSPLLGPSVFDFLKENQYNPFPYTHVQSFARQLLTSVGFVHRKRYTHTDLKPENILLGNTASDIVYDKEGKKSRKILRDTTIHLIDFGSATGDADYHATVVSTRHYRAPEIILGLGWTHTCDLWSIGCILVEFVTGEALFQTHENLEHLAMMERVFGKMPADYINTAAHLALDPALKVSERRDWFVPVGGRGKGYNLNFPTQATSKQSKKFVQNMKPLKKIIGGDDIIHSRFVDLLEGLLRWKAKDRITIDDALMHPFFNVQINDEGKNSIIPACPPLPDYDPPPVSRRK